MLIFAKDLLKSAVSAARLYSFCLLKLSHVNVKLFVAI